VNSSRIDHQFDILLTADKNLRYQQNLSQSSIAIIELPSIQRKNIPAFVEKVREL
jgi:hypothetical protein